MPGARSDRKRFYSVFRAQKARMVAVNVALFLLKQMCLTEFYIIFFKFYFSAQNSPSYDPCPSISVGL